MATVSSHILDSVTGNHAMNIRVQCFHLSGDHIRTLLFDVNANNEGRLAETVNTEGSSVDDQYELVFHAKNYFASIVLPDDGMQILSEVVVRIALPKPDIKYHIPLMISPHSYTIWWSGAAPT